MTINTYNITPPTRSTIFLNDLSCVDHAYIDDKGCIVGGSFSPCFEISGTPDSVEKVVVDFSSIKTVVKKLIDLHDFNPDNNGFDHKTWILDGYSNVTTACRSTNHPDGVMIHTPNMQLDLPSDAIKLIPRVNGWAPGYTVDYIGAAFVEFLQPRLEELYPNIDIKISCTNTTHIHVPTDEFKLHAKMFRYVHGLKDSTSYGCNNIGHGHFSFITSPTNPGNILQDIADELDNTVFIREENIVSPDSPRSPDDFQHIELMYTTPRGLFHMRLNTDAHKIVVLNTETTVEFLAQYVKERYGSLMETAGMNSFYISEGLSKGSVETL